MQRTKIEDLPINPLELITSHLDIDDLPNCVVQNKKFARAAIKTFFKKISALVTPHQTDQTTRLKAQDACVQHIAQLFKKLPDDKKIKEIFYKNLYQYFDQISSTNKHFARQMLGKFLSIKFDPNFILDLIKNIFNKENPEEFYGAAFFDPIDKVHEFSTPFETSSLNLFRCIVITLKKYIQQDQYLQNVCKLIIFGIRKKYYELLSHTIDLTVVGLLPTIMEKNPYQGITLRGKIYEILLKRKKAHPSCFEWSRYHPFYGFDLKEVGDYCIYLTSSINLRLRSIIDEEIMRKKILTKVFKLLTLFVSVEKTKIDFYIFDITSIIFYNIRFWEIYLKSNEVKIVVMKFLQFIIERSEQIGIGLIHEALKFNIINWDDALRIVPEETLAPQKKGCCTIL